MSEGLAARARAARLRVQSSFAAITPNICRQIYIDLAANRKNLAAKQRLTPADRPAYTDADFPVHAHPQWLSLLHRELQAVRPCFGSFKLIQFRTGRAIVSLHFRILPLDGRPLKRYTMRLFLG